MYTLGFDETFFPNCEAPLWRHSSRSKIMSRLIWDNAQGKSFAELAQADSKAHAHAKSITNTRPIIAAGAPSSLPPKGAGTFQQSTGWSLTDDKLKCSSMTESRRNFTEKPISADVHDAASKKHERTKDNWPTSSYITPSQSFQTVNQNEFKTKTISESERSRPTIKKDASTAIILKDVEKISYTTAYTAEFNKSKSKSSAGPSFAVRTQKIGYNIINGSPVGDQRWRYESCLSANDHRRTRGTPIE
jgi:hypothetical protein